MNVIRILLVDDHFMVRLGLAGSLKLERDMSVVAEAGDSAEALAAFVRHRPDVTLLDRRLPGRDGLETLADLVKLRPEARVAMLSVDETEEDIHQALALGAQAYLPKSLPRAELLAAIRDVHAGKRYLPAEIARRLEARNRREALTPRELEVLRMVARGYANKQIAADLGLAEITVKVHVSRVLEKLGAPDRTRATTLAIERGLIRL